MPPAALSEMMGKANGLAEEIFATTVRINEHMFGIHPATEEASPAPQCFLDVLHMQMRTLDMAAQELHEIAAKMGV